MTSSWLGLVLLLAPQNLPLESLRLAEGFSIEIYARAPGARSLAPGPPGVVFVGTRDTSVFALVDDDRNGSVDRVRTVASGLRWPNGVAYRQGALYVAERSRILRFDGMERWLQSRGGDPAPAPTVILGDLPTENAHGWKFLRLGPDGKLYFGIGAPCNVCLSDDPFATLARVGVDGQGFEIVARGIRNTVGFDWHPRTRELWFTENGADQLGDDVPSDELNRVARVGQHFGYPFCHEGGVPDPRFGARRPCTDFVAPVHKFGAHVAALGMRFLSGSGVPPPLSDRIVVAEHGSWNRSEPVGYRVVVVDPEGKRPETTLVAGWLRGEQAWGRPVDVELLPDGTLLVSDDKAGVVYRLRWTGKAS